MAFNTQPKDLSSNALTALIRTMSFEDEGRLKDIFFGEFWILDYSLSFIKAQALFKAPTKRSLVTQVYNYIGPLADEELVKEPWDRFRERVGNNINKVLTDEETDYWYDDYVLPERIPKESPLRQVSDLLAGGLDIDDIDDATVDYLYDIMIIEDDGFRLTPLRTFMSRM